MPPINQTDLQQVFDELVRLFNLPGKPDYEGMRPYLDPDIEWQRLHAATVFRGVDNVLQWLKKDKVVPNPQFKNPSQTITKNQDGSQEISGNASWQSDIHVSHDEPLEYHFTFVQDSSGKWFLRNVSGVV